VACGDLLPTQIRRPRHQSILASTAKEHFPRQQLLKMPSPWQRLAVAARLPCVKHNSMNSLLRRTPSSALIFGLFALLVAFALLVFHNPV